MNIQQVDVLPTIDAQVLAVDIETSQAARLSGDKTEGSDPHRDRIVAAQVSDGETVWILNSNFHTLAPMLVNPNIKKLIHNGAFEYKWFLKHLGVSTVNIYDTLMAERVLNSGLDMKNDLGAVLLRYLGVYTDKSTRKQFAEHTGDFTDEQLHYMALDVCHLHQIREVQAKNIGRMGMGRVMGLENSIVPILSKMELDGVGYDPVIWRDHERWMQLKIEEIYRRVVSYLDVPKAMSLMDEDEYMYFNLSSPAQVLRQLHRMGITYISDTNEKTLAYVLERSDVPEDARRFLEDVLEWRGWDKLMGVDYPAFINPVTGRIHCSWNQIQASTGRLSSSKPGLQQVRKPTEGEPNFRAPFVPDYGYVFVGGDYSQQEVYIWAALSEDERLLEACRTSDIYSAMGTIAYGYPVKKGMPERDIMKVVVLGDMYGRGAGALVGQLGTKEKAYAFKEMMARTFPKGYRFLSSQGDKALRDGYVQTALGRRRFWNLSETNTEASSAAIRREAQNMPIQGTAADITKVAILRFHEWTRERGYNDTRIVLMVHDELVVECPEEKAQDVKEGLEQAMRAAFKEVCPQVEGKIDAHISKCWQKD